MQETASLVVPLLIDERHGSISVSVMKIPEIMRDTKDIGVRMIYIVTKEAKAAFRPQKAEA